MFRTCPSIVVLFILSMLFTQNVHSQDILTQQADQQKQINQLRYDVEELQRTVDVLKRLIPRQALSPVEKPDAKFVVRPQKTAEPLTEAQRATIKAEVCKDLGLFFDQVDKALKMSDDSAAQKAMNNAVSSLHKALDRHVPDAGLRKIMDFAEGVAWDTYSAVQFRYSSAGNADFLEYLEAAKEKFKKRCSEN